MKDWKVNIFAGGQTLVEVKIFFKMSHSQGYPISKLFLV